MGAGWDRRLTDCLIGLLLLLLKVSAVYIRFVFLLLRSTLMWVSSIDPESLHFLKLSYTHFPSQNTTAAKKLRHYTLFNATPAVLADLTLKSLGLKPEVYFRS